MKRTKFKPPKDVKQWFSWPHCGLGRLDAKEVCGFCGENVLECAKTHSDNVRAHPNWLHDGGIMGDGQDDPENEMTCGGSGFWCSGCGRFWPQNSCGEEEMTRLRGADGVIVEVRGHKIYCVCGKQLARERICEK